MKVPFADIDITRTSRDLIKNALDSGRLSGGSYVRALEERFAKTIGAREAVAVSSGTDAIAIALSVLYDYGARRQDEVILPALSFAATGNAVLEAGFVPVFVDIERKTLNIDPAGTQGAITKRTKAILAVHLMGKPAEMDALCAIARKRDLFLIEDAAEAYGAEYKGKGVGTFGAMACFSLYTAHVITTVEGGMVVTDNPDYAEIVRSLRSHGRACKCATCILNTDSAYCDKRFAGAGGKDMRFISERVGYSSKMNELEAAIGLGGIEKYAEIIKRRRANLLYLIRGFSRFAPYLTTFREECFERIGPHGFPVIVGKGSGIDRDEIVDYLERKGVETRSLFFSMPTQCRGFGFLGYSLGDFPNAEYIGENGFHVGVHQKLTRAHLDYFLNATADFLKMRKKINVSRAWNSRR